MLCLLFLYKKITPEFSSLKQPFYFAHRVMGQLYFNKPEIKNKQNIEKLIQVVLTWGLSSEYGERLVGAAINPRWLTHMVDNWYYQLGDQSTSYNGSNLAVSYSLTSYNKSCNKQWRHFVAFSCLVWEVTQHHFSHSLLLQSSNKYISN